MNWDSKFAQRTTLMRRSAIRELLRLTAQPGMISFAGGLPAPELFPVEAVARAAASVLQRDASRALQYGETEGLRELRQWIAKTFSSAHRPLSERNVCIVSGGQQGLDLLGRILLDPGDKVLVESPTYIALLSAWRPLGVQFVPVRGDDEGMRLDALEEGLRVGPKVLYSIPNFQNPQGTTLSLPRREQVVSLVRAHDVILVEDNPYGDLRFEGEQWPSLFQIEAGLASSSSDGNVVYVGTFSKVLAPALRVGWVVAPEEVIDRLVRAKQAADLQTSTLNQCIVYELLNGGTVERQLPRLCAAYRERRDRMVASLEKYFAGDATWTRPQGGMFLFVTMKHDIDASAFLACAIKEQVAFVPGEEFCLDGGGRNTFRLNFTRSTPDQIEEGVQRLANAWAVFRQKGG